MLGPNSYGKSGIRLVKVTRRPDRHDLKDVTVAVRLEGDFEKAHVAGDNSAVLPTDTMKNAVYALAGETSLEQIESFGLVLARHFVESHAPVSRARVEISEHLWERLDVSGRPHRHAYRRAGEETRLARIALDRGSEPSVDAGIENLLILKTAQSSFAGFPRDRYTTLKETGDRILATALSAVWSYGEEGVFFNLLWRGVRQTLLETFADHDSKSVQHTLHAMGEAVLERHAEVRQIRLTMPNKHHLPADLTPFGFANENAIFVATEEPYGVIEATVVRASTDSRVHQERSRQDSRTRTDQLNKRSVVALDWSGAIRPVGRIWMAEVNGGEILQLKPLASREAAKEQ
ncbi:MAG: factor-independent urate hydroxylase, partial [Vicinamibacteria bacterium]